MKRRLWRALRQQGFALVIGLCDGILTALTLAGGLIAGETPGHRLSAGLALRVASAAASSGALIFFVAEYSRLRRELVEAERQLSLSREHGRLATTRLGRQVFAEALLGAAVSSSCSFAGALIPMACGLLAPDSPLLPLVVALLCLALLGAGIARLVRGRALHWAPSLLAAGLVLTWVGIRLHLVG